MLKHLEWKNNNLILLDQRKLPTLVEYFVCDDYQKVIFAIKEMIVRGAPAIGITACYGIAKAMLDHQNLDRCSSKNFFNRVCDEFAKSRPTAVNLFWAIEQMKNCFEINENLAEILLNQAIKIHKKDLDDNIKMSENGLELVRKVCQKKGKDKINILTHCNAGALATAGYGTALGLIRKANENGLVNRVFVDETRPYLQGARLTAWEMITENIPATLICDSSAGYLMKKGEIDAVVIGADRIAKNGDTANKIGSYSLSVLAKYHGIDFWVVAPTSTIDLETQTGNDIIIEERPREEIEFFQGIRIAPKDIDIKNLSFDVVDHENIMAIITEKKVFYIAKHSQFSII